jgi:hypothetical protein
MWLLEVGEVEFLNVRNKSMSVGGGFKHLYFPVALHTPQGMALISSQPNRDHEKCLLVPGSDGRALYSRHLLMLHASIVWRTNRQGPHGPQRSRNVYGLQ